MILGEYIERDRRIQSARADIVNVAEAWRDAQVTDWDNPDRLAAVHNQLVDAVDRLRAATLTAAGCEPFESHMPKIVAGREMRARSVV